MLWTVDFWKGAGERALKTFFQTLVAMIAVTAGAGQVPTVGIEGVDWIGSLSVAALAAVLSLATSIGNADFTAGEPAPGRAIDADGDGQPDYAPSNN